MVVQPADTARNGYAWAKGIVADMNELWNDNPPQWGNYAQVELLAYGAANTAHRSQQLLRMEHLPDRCALMTYTPQ